MVLFNAKVFSLLVVLIVTGIQKTNSLECPSQVNKTLVALPLLDPDQYSYEVEIILKDQGRSFDLLEFYDASTASLYRFGDIPLDSNTYKHVALTYDYNLMQKFIVKGTGDDKTCTVESLMSDQDQKSIFYDGFSITNPGVSNFTFSWSHPHNATFEGLVETSDGLILEQYQTCMMSENNTRMYLVDAFYRHSNDSIKIPVQLNLNSTQEGVNSTTTNSLTTYKLSSYRSSQHQRQWSPSHPSGVICPGRKDEPNITLPLDLTRLHMVAQESSSEGEMVSSEMFFDFPGKISSVDRGNTKIVLDYNQGVQFKMIRGSGCVVSAIPEESPFGELLADDVFVNMSRGVVPELASFNSYQYGGVTRFEGSHVYEYISTAQSTTNASNTLYVAKNGQVVAIRHKVAAKSNNATSDVYVRIIPMEGAQDGEHDVTRCYETSESRDFSLEFSLDHLQAIEQNFNSFTESLLSNIACHANVSRLRLGSRIRYHIADADMENEKAKPDPKLYVAFTLLPLYKVNGSISQSNISEAIVKLTKVVSENEFKISFQDGNKTLELIAYPDYLMGEDELISGRGGGGVKPGPSPVPPSPHPHATGGMSGGQVVGVSMACLVVGAVCGFLLFTWRQRRSMTFNYSAFDSA